MEGRVSGQSYFPSTIGLRKTRYPLYRRLVGFQCLFSRLLKISSQLGFYPRSVQPVSCHYNDWAIEDLNETFSDIIISDKYSYILWKLSSTGPWPTGNPTLAESLHEPRVYKFQVPVLKDASCNVKISALCSSYSGRFHCVTWCCMWLRYVLIIKARCYVWHVGWVILKWIQQK
jgi:hypothetical protein